MPFDVRKWIARGAGSAAALTCLSVGWVLQGAFGVIYEKGTPGFLVQYTVSLVFLSVVLGEFVSKAITRKDATYAGTASRRQAYFRTPHRTALRGGPAPGWFGDE